MDQHSVAMKINTDALFPSLAQHKPKSQVTWLGRTTSHNLWISNVSLLILWCINVRCGQKWNFIILSWRKPLHMAWMEVWRRQYRPRLALCDWKLTQHRHSSFTFTFTFMHLADAFIQSDLQLHSGYTFSLVCVFPGNRTHNLLRCWRNALPLSHTGTLQKVKVHQKTDEWCLERENFLCCNILSIWVKETCCNLL